MKECKINIEEHIKDYIDYRFSTIEKIIHETVMHIISRYVENIEESEANSSMEDRLSKKLDEIREGHKNECLAVENQLRAIGRILNRKLCIILNNMKADSINKFQEF